MSSKVFRMWPAVALALLMAVVWHWGVPAEPAQAQTAPVSTPATSLSVNWQWVGGTVELSASGLTPETRAFAYAMWSPDSTPACRDVSVVANQVGDDLVEHDGSVSFDLTVASPAFQAGNHNYLCVIDGLQRGIDLPPLRLRAVERPPFYRMRLDVTSIVQAPDDDYVGGAMPRHLAVVDGRHWDNWRLPQRRTFGVGARLGHVSNLGRVLTADPVLFPGVGGGVEVANSFTTGGGVSERFVISSVVVDFDKNADNVSVGIYSNDATAGGQPGTQVGSDLNWSGVSKGGEVTFARGDLVLAGGATYWLVFKSRVAQGSNEPIVRTVDDGGEDSGGLASWSIGDVYKYRNGNTGNWSALNGSSRVVRFRVNVAEATPKGVDVMPTELSVPEGSSKTYMVRLDAPPTSAVTVTVSNDGPDVDLTVDTDLGADGDQNTLTFTTTNWATSQKVTVKAVQDTDSLHGKATFTHVASGADPGYGASLTIAPVKATEADDDDTTVPTCASATAVGDVLTITCDEAMKINSKPGEGAFAVTVDGVKRELSGYNISGSTVILKLVRPVASTQTVTVAYTKPDSVPVLEDAAGNHLVTFGPLTATNGSDDTPPTFSKATVSGTTLVVAFNEELAAAHGLANDAFTVKKTPTGGNEQPVALSGSPRISGKTVTLTLASAMVATDADVKVSYAKPDSGSDNKLKDVANNEVDDFTDEPVTIGRLHDGPLVSTYGQWHRCEDRLVSGSGIQLGCGWEARGGDTSRDKVYLEPVEHNAAPVQVPGDTMQLRIFLDDADLGVRKAAERYVVFWGPVDLWLLGAGGGVEPQDFVIQEEHLNGIRSRTVVQDDLVNGAFTLDLERRSANYRGDTFVSLVPCNDDYLEGKFDGDEFDRAQRAFRDCTQRSAAGVPRLNGGDSESTPEGVREAWSQHDPLSGLGLSCSVTLDEERRIISCRNDLVEAVTPDEYEDCMRVLRNSTAVGAIKCGMGHQGTPYGAQKTANWGSTRYNAAMSFYGFVIDWQRGYAGGQGRPGCDVNLLPYRVSGGRFVGFPGLGTGRWLTGEVGGASDEDCIADPGEDEVEVDFYTPESIESWSDAQEDWHDTHPVHFAVYVSGMASEYGGAAGVEGIADWKRVQLGTWEADESVPYGRARGFTRLGLWYPHSGAGVSEVSGVRLPSMESMNGGKGLTVPRDFAGLDGVVRLFVVPCLPTYSERGITLGVCEDLPAREGPVSPVLFGLEARQAGPFGYDRNTSIISYSIGVTVIFRSGPDGEGVSRSVSHPPVVQVPTGDICGITSLAPAGGSSYWPEVTVQGGACDRNDLNAVPVTIANAGGAADDRLVVYATGGRTEGLDKVRMRRAGVDPGDSEFGRLGLRERVLSLAAGENSATIHISPDLANRSGEIWLVAYSCGGASRSARCPTVDRDRVPVVYDIAVPSAFVIVIKFTAAAGLSHTELAPVCHGDDCDLKVGRDVPILREAPPESSGECAVSSYGGGSLWPDRLVRGGPCSPDGLGAVPVKVRNDGAVDKHLVLYATGGRDAGLGFVQVRRGDSGAPSPAGAVGLRRVRLSLSGGSSGTLLVEPDLADENGHVLVLAYLCSGAADADCPSASSSDDATVYAVERRPLFQVLVEYDPDLVVFSSLRICRGDSCNESYPLGRVSAPSGTGCAVRSQTSGGRQYWPDALVTGADCERDTLDDVPVSFELPAGVSGEKLTVYVTGGRSAGLEQVSVRRDTNRSSGSGSSAYVGYLSEEPSYSVISASVAVPEVIAGKSWVTDGLTPQERRAIGALTSLGASVDRVGRMPFLNEFDEMDHLTLRALAWANSRGAISAILGHSSLAAGISDADRVKVIGVSTMVHSDPVSAAESSNIRSRLSSGYVLANGVSNGVAITVASVSGSARSDVVAMVTDEVGDLRTLMARDFPVDDVLLFLDEDSVPSGAGGANFGGYAISFRPDAQQLRAGIAHEVAHYYWRGAAQRWIDEGIASAAEVLVAGAARRPEAQTCTNLRSLVDVDPSLGDDAYICNYYLGQRLFLELDGVLGRDEFSAGLGRLYDRIQGCLGRDGCGAIDDVRAAFPANRSLIDQHWGLADVTVPGGDSNRLGRLGLREDLVTVTAGQSASVMVSPDLADANGYVWLFAYRCVGTHGDSGCPLVGRPALNGYHLSKGPDFAVLVKFADAPGFEGAELREVCRGTQCDIPHPWLRQAEPSVDECAVDLPAHWDFWPDRVVRGGGCYFRGTRYGSVDFRAEGEEKFVVYSTGGNGHEIELVPVYGVLKDAADAAGEQLGLAGLNEHRMDVAAGDSGQVWLRSEMADDHGNVWLFVYRCDDSFDDDGCPLVGRDVVRPSYDIGIRPAFVVRAGFVAAVDAGRSTLDVRCSGGVCALTAVFRDSAGDSLPGRAEFRVDRGGLGSAGSTALSSQQPHTGDAVVGYSFVETLQLPSDGGVVNVEVELLGDGTLLERTVGVSSSVERLSTRVMRCSDGESTCHDGVLEPASTLSRGDWFVIEVTGHDAAGSVGLSAGRQTRTVCAAGPSSPWPTIALSTNGLRSYNYGTGQRADRGYAGCAYRVADDASFGSHGYTVSFSSGGSALSASGVVTVGRSAGDLAYLGITGPSRLESGDTGDYRVFGYNSAGLPVAVEGGCVDVTVSGAISGATECFVEGFSSDGEEFTVTANADVVLNTDSSVGVAHGDLSVRKHVLVVPAEEDSAPAPVVGDSHISSLAIEQEDTQLRMSWVGSPTPAFASMRAQVWVQVGGVDEFLPGCLGGEPHDVSTHQVFCLLSYGQSGDVYHAAVGYIRHDGSSVPVETVQWVRP